MSKAIKISKKNGQTELRTKFSLKLARVFHETFTILGKAKLLSLLSSLKRRCRVLWECQMLMIVGHLQFDQILWW